MLCTTFLASTDTLQSNYEISFLNTELEEPEIKKTNEAELEKLHEEGVVKFYLKNRVNGLTKASKPKK